MQNYHLYYKKLSWFDPEQVFLSLFADKKYSFWLDFKDYSYMGLASKTIKYTLSNYTLIISNKHKTQKLDQSILSYLQKELTNSQLPTPNSQLPTPFTGGFIGYFGYEMRHECDCLSLRERSEASSPARQACAGQSRRSNPLHRGIAALPPVARNDKKKPDAYFFFVDKFLAFDHQEKKLYLVALAKSQKETYQCLTTMKSQINSTIQQHNNKKLSSLNSHFSFPPTPSRSRHQYLKDIRICQKYLKAGNAYQICLTNQFTTNIQTNWLSLFLTLRRANPAPFSAYLNFGRFALLSSSPEQFLQVDQKNWVIGKPMKGTIRASDNPRLFQNPKYSAENMMIVDLVRNDLGKICEFGSIKVDHPLAVETYATVRQLVSTIKGKLLPGKSVIDLIQACFPPGSMTGAPKITAMKIIEELEKAPRGIYSGVFGFLSLNGTANLAVTIRTIIATKNQLFIGSGGAILTDSNPEEEYNEMLLKTKALIETIKSAC